MEEKKTKDKEIEKETKPKTTKKKSTTPEKKTSKNATSSKKTKKSAPKSTASQQKGKEDSPKEKKAPEGKKTEVKKTTPSKKTTPKVETKKQEKKVEIIEETPEKKTENLEKTIIFDGNQSKNIKEVVNKLEEENVVLEDKVIKRSKARKVIIVILVLLIFAVIAATACYVIAEHNYEKESNQTLNSNIYKKVSRKYKTIEEIDNQAENEKAAEETNYENIETLTLLEFEKKALNKEDMTVFVASTTCYPCITFEPIINEVYSTLNKKIYRINVSALTTEETTRFRTYYAFTVTPTIFTVKEGIVTAETTGIMTNEELTNWVNQNGV